MTAPKYQPIIVFVVAIQHYFLTYTGANKMAKLTAEQIEFVEVFFGERALALRERIANKDYDDADELAGIESDIRALLAVEITEDTGSVYRALGVCDDRDGMVAMLEEEEMGAEIVEIMFDNHFAS